MSRSFKEVIQDAAIRRWFKDNYSFHSLTDSGSGITAGRLAEVTSNEIKVGTEQATAILGATRGTITASATDADVEFGAVPCYLASPVAKMDNIAPRAAGMVGKSLSTQVTLLAATAGGGFANQPAGDTVEVLSSSAEDTTQTVTIYGTITGKTTTITSETVSLAGTDVVATTQDAWVTVLAVKLSASCAGTVTIQEGDDADITTITTTVLSAGVATPSTTNAYGLIPRHDASGASTKILGLVGTDVNGDALTSVDALNGTTEEDHGTAIFATITEVYLGDIAATTSDVSVLTNESTDSVNVGVALEASTVSGVSIDCYIKPYFY